MSLFIPITKVDVAQRLVYGTLSEESPDKTGEILDYASAKPEFEAWSRSFQAASNGKSFGNVRAMHGAVAAGKLTGIAFDDANKRIEGIAKIVDEDEWNKVVEGVYTGFSIGGGYARRWQDPDEPGLMRYTPTLSEVSLVDNPALPAATFDVIKRDGSIECRKFCREANMTKAIGNAYMADVTQGDDTDFFAPHILDILDDMSWLEEEARLAGNNEIIACLATLQEFLHEEYDIGNNRDGEEQEDDDDTASSDDYAAELADPDGDEIDDEAPHPRATRKRRRENTKMLKQVHIVAAQVTKLQKRISELEMRPLPAKGVLRAVNKSDDYPTQRDALGALTPSERAHELMKMAMANPLEM